MPPAPYTQNAGYYYIFGINFVKSRTIYVFNEFNAFGRFKTTLGRADYTNSIWLAFLALEFDDE